MGFFDGFKRSIDLQNYSGWNDILINSRSATGINVNVDSSLKSATVKKCISLRSETIASLPINLFQKTSNGKEISNLPLQTILHTKPNPEMSSYNFREMLQINLDFYGNAYCEIERDRAGRIIALWPLLSQNMQVKRNYKNQIEYHYQVDGYEYILLRDKIFHIPGMGFDGLVGYPPLLMYREVIGGNLATQEFGNKFFGNGAHIHGVLEHPGNLGKGDARKNIEDSFQKMYSGLSNSHKVAVLEEGMQYKPLSIPNDQAQFLESRSFSVVEICRIFNIPPHKVYELSRATFSNIEEQNIEFVSDTILPIAARWENNINCQLLTDIERKKLFSKFMLQGLLRGKQKERTESYRINLMNGVMSPNDVRELEDMNTYEGGDTYLVPLNMQNVKNIDKKIDENNDSGAINE